MMTIENFAMITTLRDAALAYGKRGWSVLPLHGIRSDGTCTCSKPDCKSPGKHPRTPNGLNDASKDPQRVNAWWRRWPHANIGIRTGRESGLVVLDVDPRHGGDNTLQDLERARSPLPDTVEAITGGGGQHLFFQHPGRQVRTSAGQPGPGLDVRGDGGYVVAPPSMHLHGRRYEWKDSHHPDAVDLAELPAWLSDRVRVPKARKDIGIKTSGASRETEKIPEGVRNHTLASLAGSMRRGALSEPAIRAALLAENNTRCVPPLPEDEVVRIAASISRYSPEPNGQEPDWRDPEPLAVATEPPADYPLEALPPTLQRAAQEVARFAKVPVASPAVIGLSVAATALRKHVRIEERPGLYHRPALFHALIAASGERKTPAFKHMTASLEEWEAERMEGYKAEVCTVEANNAVVTRVIAAYEKQVNKQITELGRNEIVGCIASEKARIREVPPSPRLFTTNATEEMVFRLMYERGGAFAVMSGEGRPVIDLIIGKYSGEGKTGDAIYLAGVSGDTISRDRIGNEHSGQEAKIIRDPMLNVCVMVQPDKYMDAARHPRLRESGALARIWPVWLPSLVGERIEEPNEPGLDNKETEPYFISIRQLLDFEPALDDHGQPKTHLLRLGPDAAEARREWHNVVEVMMGDGGEFEDVRDIASKAVTATVKAAAVLHVLQHPEYLHTNQSEISLETWKRAQLLGEYHLGEAIRVQRMAGEDQQLHDARRVLEWLGKKWADEKGCTAFKVRTLQREGPRPRPNAAEAKRTCNLLKDFGWIKRLPPRGDDRSPTFAVHPHVANVANVARGKEEKLKSSFLPIPGDNGDKKVCDVAHDLPLHSETDTPTNKVPQDSVASGIEHEAPSSSVTTADREASWDSETTALIEWFMTTTAPTKPFELCPGFTIYNPLLLWNDLRRDIVRGPNGPLARGGVVRRQLFRLAKLFGGPVRLRS